MYSRTPQSVFMGNSRNEPVISRLPFGPPAKEMSKLIDENVRRHTEENNIKQSMKAVYAQSQATSAGFYAQRLSKNNNYIIPALPRPAPQ